MFPYSSQKKHWMFCDENEINKLRENANANYNTKFSNNPTVSYYLIQLH